MRSVLIVDDSVSMRTLLIRTLEDSGFEVSAAEDGIEALELAKKRSVDLVITDVNMPNMDGIALVEELRKLRDFKFTPILVLTTETSSELKSRARGHGATGWLVKPFDPDRLLATIKTVLD